MIRRPDLLEHLAAPWPEARPHGEVLVERKLASNHLDRMAVERALLRRQARQVQRLEEQAAWRGEEPLWLVASHLPGMAARNAQPGVLVLTVRDLLERLGCDVHIAPFVPNGKALHVKGFLGRFEKRARKTAAVLRRFAEGGATLVAIEPAVGLTYRDEYRHLLGKDLGFQVELLQELLVRIVPEAPPGAAPGERYRLFGHCTEKTLAPASQQQWATVFARLGLGLELVATGCCGMSGAFGHEWIHRDESEGIWALSWGRWLADGAADPSHVLATGCLCRSQAHRFGQLALRHPAEVLLAHLSRPS